MPDLDRASIFVQETMDQFDDPGVTLAALTRRCERIASLRGDAVALAWLRLESTDIANEFENKGEATRESLAARLLKSVPANVANAMWSVEYDGYIARRRTGTDKREANLRSIQQIENVLRMLREQEEAATQLHRRRHADGVATSHCAQTRARRGDTLVSDPSTRAAR
jgi:hypothetical protein